MWVFRPHGALALTTEIIMSVIRTNRAEAMVVALDGGAVQAPLTEPMKSRSIEGKFTLIKTIKDVEVPKEHNHKMCLATLAKERKEGKHSNLSFLSDYFTDRNFAQATNRLPGEKYDVDVYGINGRVSSEDCLELSQKGKLVGAQGLSVLYRDEKAREQLPEGILALAFDKEENLPQIEGHRQVPGLFCGMGGYFELVTRHWNGNWSDHVVVLVFRDCES